MTTIQLLNPDPLKKGAVVDEQKYKIVKEAILSIVEEQGTIGFKDLMSEVVGRLKESIDGSPSWYCTAVKLDLESRGILERIEGKGPQQIRLKR
ncbi:hypothetical protein AM500_12170 [Bacillus sp. FJAT-18017]|uniref:DUF6958 family protein n=1 Tax=Bacillus sp. FJAT-18017 TaxID=1705566 RepID=UPI0006AFAEA9|nr:hypothetical protein [Bacillus sp. FJAT-18017]ALC90457.1 hypothetical protein AM500_12170 [Bacillus sp. FJAT-18017]